MGDLLVLVHGGLRWPVLALGVGGFVLAASAWSRGADSRLTQVASAIFVGLLDLQLLLGVLILIVDADARGTGWQHAAVMIVAVTVAHYFRFRAKRLAAHEARRYLVAGFFAPMVLIVVAVTVLI